MTSSTKTKTTTTLKPFAIATIAAALLSLGMINTVQPIFAIDVDEDGEEDEGCTVKFWKKNTDLWPAPLTPNTQFDQVFGFEVPGKADLTLIQALKLKGGGQMVKMVKQGTGASLNAAFVDDDLNYPYSKSTTIRNVVDGLDPQFIQSDLYGDDDDLKERLQYLKKANKQICPFIER
jgi:hypothetical protein